jgi:hypothetical protein
MSNRRGLADLEARLQSLIEGGLARLFNGGAARPGLAARLIDALQREARPGAHGSRLAPNLFILRLPPAQAAYFDANPADLASLEWTLRQAAEEDGLVFTAPLVVRLEPVDSLSEVEISARFSQQDLPQTSSLEAALENDPGAEPPPNAFLIVDGTRIVPLVEAVLSLGRRPDNQIVVDDPRVSRVHAQLRAVRGAYVIFDLNSSGGTLLNGEPIHQATLAPGDVISLAGVPLVYGQDEHAATQDLPPRPAP